MLSEVSSKYLRKLSRTFLWFIFFLKRIDVEVTADNRTNTTSNQTTVPGDISGVSFQIILYAAGGGFIVIGGLALLTYVVVVYIKRERVRDLESGSRKKKSSNNYASHVPKPEEKTHRNQVEMANVNEKSDDENEDEDVIEIHGHYARVEFATAGSKSAVNRNAMESKSKEPNLEQCDVEDLYTKSKKNKKKNADHDSNSVHAQATRTKDKQVEDMYTKVKDKKRRKKSTDDELYTKSTKQNKKGISASANGSLDELYTKSQKQQKGGTSDSATGSVDELYTKSRKKRRQFAEKDVEEMYSKPEKKKKIVPVYMNSAKVEKVKNSRSTTPGEEDDSKDDETRTMAVMKDNELYTDCPDLNES